MMVEFANGQLPWRKIKDKEQVSERLASVKRTLNTDRPADKLKADA